MHYSCNGTNLFQLIPPNRLNALVEKWEIDKGVRNFPTTKLIQVLLLANLFHLESFREIEKSFGIPKSTLSDACGRRPSGFFADLCQEIWGLIAAHSKNRGRKILKAVDSSECRVDGRLLKFKGWRKGGGNLSGVKLHAVWDVYGAAISDFRITHATASDLSTAQQFSLQKEATYVFDRAYTDLRLWLKITKNQSHFVTRLKKSARYEFKHKSLHLGSKSGVLYDGTWTPSDPACRRLKLKPKTILFRHIIYRAEDKLFDFITSDFDIPAQEVADIYKKRWSVELLFRWLKGHLDIRQIPLRSPNGVRVMLAMNIILHLLLELKRLREAAEKSLLEVFRALRSDLFKVLLPRAPCASHHQRSPPVADLAA